MLQSNFCTFSSGLKFVAITIETIAIATNFNPELNVQKVVCNILKLWRVWVRRGGCIGSWWGNRREGDHWGDLGVDGWIILGWISRRWDVGIWTGLGGPRIETGGGRF